jgi:RNA polymerase sigma-70 factor, ECF subfamily
LAEGGEPGLLRRVRDGERLLAFDEVVDRYGNDLYRLALSFVGNPDDAEDILQETYAAAFERRGSFKGESSLKTWLISILVRRAARHHRYRRIWKTVSLHLLGGVEESGLAEDTAISPVKELELRMDVRRMMDSLSRKHREVLVLREVMGLSYQEISEVLGIPTGTVESRLFRAREDLRSRFAEYLKE